MPTDPPLPPTSDYVVMGACRFCGQPVWGRDAAPAAGPAHGCCEIHARENPGQPCIACAASAAAARNRRRG